MLQGVMVTLKNSNNIIQLIVNLCNLLYCSTLVIASNIQKCSLSLNLLCHSCHMPKCQDFFKTLLMIYFLPLSDSEYLLCSISLSLLALPVTLKKRKKKPKSDRSLFADVQFLGSELHGCLCNYDVVASSKGHLNCS